MSNLDKISTEMIQTLINDTELSLKDLKAEMARREEEAQDFEISDLETHMRKAELSLTTIRDFVHFLVNEYRSHP
ncbi:hypothetical protein SAMN06265222_114126 [Neorhodopirellula lusitana]|uniref:Uncharacterized protein n=1 Tax=Neorhodopirellula lusitana TaxID=445327 RepID=A0ABY1QIJ1_9BACT|nr:hypothetical protein [Neorhodopirellula lusitana]SMP71854.1 hypothetical protein SAMN06265222_114126 [Neorhodopirellula lusitana]